MGDNSLRQTALLAVGLAALLAAVLAAPGAAAQTERYNESIPSDPNTDYLISLDDTGNTTLSLLNSTGAELSTIDSDNITDDRLLPVNSSDITGSRAVVESERPGVNVRTGNITTRATLVPAGTPMRIETTVQSNSTVATIPLLGGQFAPLYNISDTTDKTTVEFDYPTDGSVFVVVLSPVEDNQTSQDVDLVERFINRTIQPDNAVEALRVMQSNAALVKRARVRIMDSSDGTTLINESLPDAQTSVGYGAVAFDNSSEYRVTVTGVNNFSDNQAPDYTVKKLKSNSPLFAINQITDSSAQTLLTLGLAFVAIIMILRTRD